jgi:acyl-CoA synthetase (NDP forming)
MLPPPLAELLVTLRSDPQFGPCLVLGSGGVLTELVGDVATLLLPASADEIAAALRSLRAARLLDGFRGAAKADIAELAQTLLRLCLAFQEERHSISEIEINPMFVYQDRSVAVDALIQVARP